MTAEKWAYPVAIAWQRALDSLSVDRDPRSHYRALEHAWSAIHRLIALCALGAHTPTTTGSPSLNIGLLTKPTAGNWDAFLDKALPPPRRLDQYPKPVHWLSNQYWEARQLGAAAQLLGELGPLIGEGCRRRVRTLSLRALFKQLVWLRNRAHHDAPWDRQRTRRVVELLRPCLEELLSLAPLRDGLALRLEDEAHGGMDLTGSTELAHRGSAGFWIAAAPRAGASGELDLHGLMVIATCLHCHELQLFWLDCLGDLTSDSPQEAPQFACVGCGGQARNATWTKILRPRLSAAVAWHPWVEPETHHLRCHVSQETDLVFRVFNPLLHSVSQVEIDLRPPDDVDLLGELPRLKKLNPRARAKLIAKVFPRATGLHVLRPTLAWQGAEEQTRRIDSVNAAPGKLSLELQDVTLEAGRQGAGLHLVGREAELARFLQAYQQACLGHCSLIVLEGKEGVGRSALIEALIHRLPREAVVLASRCQPDDLRHNQPLTDLVLKYARYYLGIERLQLKAGTTDVLLFPGDLLAAVRAVSDYGQLGITSAMLRHDGELDAETLDEHAALAFSELIDTIGSTHPALVLCIEDIENAHPQTLAVLRALAAGSRPRRLLLVISRKPQPIEYPVERGTALARLENLAADVCQLAPFSKEQVSALLDQRYPGHGLSAAFCQRIWTTTGGLPYFVTQTLDSLEATGVLARVEREWVCTVDPESIDVPAEIAKVIEKRLRKLPPAYLEVVQHAAILGHRFPPRLLQEALGQVGRRDRPLGEGLQIAHMLDELDRTYEVIRSIGPEFEFSHHRLWNAAYHQLRPDERAKLHGLVVSHLQESHPPSLERDLMIADHALCAGAVHEALGYTLSVAERAVTAGRYEQLFYLTERALALSEELAADVPERRTLMIQAAMARRHVGRLDEAIQLEQRNIELARAVNDQAQVTRSLVNQAHCWTSLGKLREADAVLQTAVNEAETSGDVTLQAEVLALQAAVLQVLGEGSRSRAAAEQCLARCNQAEGAKRARADCFLTMARHAHAEGDYQRALDLGSEAKDLYLAGDFGPLRGRADYALSWTYEALGDLTAALKAAEAALAIRETAGDVLEAAKARLRLGQLLTRTGALSVAREHLSRARLFWERLGSHERTAESILAVARLEHEVDRARLAADLAGQALELYREVRHPTGIARALSTRLRAMLRDASEEDIRQAAAAAWNELPPQLEKGVFLEHVLVQVAIRRFLKDLDGAAALLREYVGHAEATGSALLKGSWHLEQANVLRALGEFSLALDAAEQAVVCFTGSGDALLACQGKTLTASLLVDLGRLDQAEKELLVLEDLCDDLNDPLGHALCLRQLGRICLARGETSMAEEHFEASREIHHDLQDFRGIGVLADVEKQTSEAAQEE